jgi:hypothetical protein
MSIQRCVNDLLMRGADDLIQAAEVASVAIEVGGATTQEGVLEMSLEMIRHVVQRGLMEIGDALGVGSHPTCVHAFVQFQPWNLPFEEAIARVEREWHALGRNPTLGEICWLQNTSKGREIGEELHRRRKLTP